MMCSRTSPPATEREGNRKSPSGAPVPTRQPSFGSVLAQNSNSSLGALSKAWCHTVNMCHGSYSWNGEKNKKRRNVSPPR